MKILKTALLLIITLLVVPIFTYAFGTPLDEVSKQALHAVLITAAIAIAYSFIAGELSGNNSQVDKLWSILPMVYAWIIAHHGNYAPRLVIMLILVCFWGIRLTYNFSRHGAFRLRFWEGKEDYRWAVLRARPEFQARWRWTLFNLFFISGYQQILILLFTLPMLIALQFRSVPLGPMDWIVGSGMLFFIVLEAIADQQQWNYQSEKKRLTESGAPLTGDYKKGFLDRGLWAYSRHPNYFAEQAIWVCFYLFSVTASGEWLNWSIAGCLLLILLFQGSSSFSEEISAGKYPEYAAYQERVPRFFGMRKRSSP